ncbi:hypothetical protein BDP27DRAFT_203838 [Rhodocollybia butyracea]|uniref:Uncharacterized protein n=1 Tax=Rhodocollybia butyracea TaxID=206335 RepID=A0A9P5PII7_9AGAR|nr:hypothetical protein BDP27DRAFT_203838 [Rhodocollybia butyracea]
MRSIEPLLSVLPKTTVVDGKKILLIQITPSSWDRLEFYTSRVREFTDSGRLNAHKSVYTFLGQRPPIFPNLKILRLLPGMCNSSTFLFFLSSTLQEACVLCPALAFVAMAGQVLDIGPSLALLVAKSPGIKSLDLQRHIYSGLAHSLHALHDLERLSVMHLASPFLGREFVKAIASLPRLTHLILTFSARNPLDYEGTAHGFPFLREVWLEGTNAHLHRFLTCLSCNLRRLDLSWGNDNDREPPLGEIADVTRMLLKFSFPLPEKLCLHNIVLPLTADFDDSMLWSVFEPLLELKRLKELGHNGALSLSDERTATIACV